MSGTVNCGYVFRFEAEGHKPFITRAYHPDEGEVRLDVELMSAQDVRAIAYQPDGKSAPNAQVGLVSPGTEVNLVPGGFAGDLGHALAWLRRADPDGWFTVPDDDEIERVIVASPDGYAEARTGELREARAVRLVPWSRVEGSVRTDGQPISHAEVRLLWNSPALALSFNAPSVRTDSEGRFAFPQVPPRSFQLFVGAFGLSTPWRRNYRLHCCC